jgi:hypothetical protein
MVNIRSAAVFSIVKSYRPSIPITFVTKELGFDSEAECTAYLDSMNVVITGGDVDCSSSLKSISRPDTKRVLL